MVTDPPEMVTEMVVLLGEGEMATEREEALGCFDLI
jgi:hypothetical protein